MTKDNFCFYLQNRLIQTSETGGQWYSDTSPFSIPWVKLPVIELQERLGALSFCQLAVSSTYTKWSKNRFP
jgi:hypothetical protein